MSKTCPDCSKVFEPRTVRTQRCEGCRAARRTAYQVAYTEKNRERYRQNARKWHTENRDRAREAKARKRVEQREHVLALEAEKRKQKAEERRRAAREYYWRNREKVLARMSTDEGRAYARDRMRRTMRDPVRRLHSNISSLVRQSLKDGKGRRSWETLLGYTRDELAEHLERQFLKGMGWHNMGEWHVDHIVPRCAFSFDGPDHPDFMACWALTNLRPLWARDNLSKSGNRLHLV